VHRPSKEFQPFAGPYDAQLGARWEHQRPLGPATWQELPLLPREGLPDPTLGYTSLRTSPHAGRRTRFWRGSTPSRRTVGMNVRTCSPVPVARPRPRRMPDQLPLRCAFPTLPCTTQSSTSSVWSAPPPAPSRLCVRACRQWLQIRSTTSTQW
jgi:hypothetical protein